MGRVEVHHVWDTNATRRLYVAQALRSKNIFADSSIIGLDDLCVRFIINLPQEDLSSVARICFQVEEAQWFYEDFIRPLDPTLPSMSLRTFCLRIFQHCPLLASFSVENHTKAFEEFLQYKTRVPVRGAILLNEAMDSTVLVKGWKKGANWSFPRGKINKDEDDLDCAVREVYEETGLDLRAAGLVPTEGKPKYIEIAMREQHMRLYVFRDVPMDTNFQPRTRKEISRIEWYKLSELPAFRKKGAQGQDSTAGANANKFYMVAPFLVPLKKWVVSQKKLEARKFAPDVHAHTHMPLPIDEVPTEDDTWTQTEGGYDTSSKGPAIETLEGATQELQRLLKVQPATQGIQPNAAPRQDKGSALLSLLQAKGPAPIPQTAGQVPHTPLDLTMGEAPQPHTPHHHHHPHQQTVSLGNQQPPPSFPYPPDQSATSWNNAYAGSGAFAQNLGQQFHAGSQQPYGNQQTPLAHPQPLPPQVQRAVFNRSTFQDGQQSNHSGVPIVANQAASGHTGPQIPPMPQHAMSGQLNGQSMALLNAFKSSPVATQRKEPDRLSTQGYEQGFPQMAARENPHAASQSPKELAGSRVGPPADDHRSALLGMFRKSEPQTTPSLTQNTMGYGTSPAAAGKHQLDLLAQFQKVSPLASRSSATGQPPMQGTAPEEVSHQLDSLFIQPRAPVPQANVYPTQPSQPTNQPMRILQRGQAEPTLSTLHPRASPQMSPHAQPMSGQYASPTMAMSQPKPAAGGDQKRQLLSLFSKQQQQPLPTQDSDKGKEVVPEVARARIASLAGPGGEVGLGSETSSRRGSQTPISPAERSFLLGYLNSVTNSATR